MPAIPKNWPANVLYVATPKHSKHLTAPQREALIRRQPQFESISPEQTPALNPLVKVVTIGLAGHPANGQRGLFATRSLKPGSFVTLYLGTVHGGRDTDVGAAPESDYDLWLERDEGLAVNAAKGGNEARFINDYRGIAERPNAEFRQVWSQRFGQRCMAVFVLPTSKSLGGKSNAVGKGGISKGQEILVSYGKGFWSHRAGGDAEGP